MSNKKYGDSVWKEKPSILDQPNILLFSESYTPINALLYTIKY